MILLRMNGLERTLLIRAKNIFRRPIFEKVWTFFCLMIFKNNFEIEIKTHILLNKSVALRLVLILDSASALTSLKTKDCDAARIEEGFC